MVLDLALENKISVGIGADYGRALMVKAGFSGSGLNDVIWMGDVVNSACHIANTAGRDGYEPIMISNSMYLNLKEDNQNLLNYVWIDYAQYYQGNIVNTYMNEWYEKHCN